MTRDRTVHVFGAKGEVTDVKEMIGRVDPISDDLGVDIQLVNASKVYGKEHLEVAAEKAIRAFDEGRNFANTLPVEVLLYASAQRQISEAMAFMGLRQGDMDIGIVVLAPADMEVPEGLPERMGLEPDDSVLEGSEVVLDAFGIGPDIRKGVPQDRWGDLVLERVALLDLEK